MTLSRAGLGLVELTVPPDSPAAGRPVKALELPNTINLVLIVRADQNLTPTGDTVLEPEDRIFALVTDDGDHVLRETILGEGE
jgi:trk system potassium uptake protein TrkA